uniref:Uncharacterized protein n=1 Tax=Anguilla anguilla TaxID=7936 RepID=A0A0E9PT91_ANGAN
MTKNFNTNRALPMKHSAL